MTDWSNVTFPLPTAVVERRSGPSLSAIAVALACIAFAVLAKHHSARKKGLVGAAPEPKAEPAPPPTKEKERRMEYVFREVDIADVQQHVAAGAVTITKLLVHPIKSCRGTSVTEAKFTPSGLEFDRTWCIIDASTHKIITAREIPKMVLIYPKIIEDHEDPSRSRLEVSFPPDSGCETFSLPLRPSEATLKKWDIVEDCTVFAWTGLDGYICEPLDNSLSPTLCSDVLTTYFGREVQLIFKGPRVRATRPTENYPELSVPFNFQDGYPLLVASEESFEGVRDMTELWRQEQRTAVPDDVARHIDTLVLERFRPNVVVRGGGKPFAEDMWQKISIAPADMPGADGIAFDLVSKCTRCMLPNVDPKTGDRNLAVPSKPLGVFRKGLDPARKGDSCFGCNAIPADSGILRVGDVVTVRQWAHV